MGAPYFKVKSQFERHQVAVFSSNYALYGDMSHRVMTILEELAPAVHQYSIDEAFVNLAGIHRSEELESFGRHVRSTLLQCTGLTVGVGIGPTKTLAKLDNFAAKRWPKLKDYHPGPCHQPLAAPLFPAAYQDPERSNAGYSPRVQ